MPLDREQDRPNPRQIDAWRKLGAEGRTALGIRLRRQARRWKLDALRARHPTWSDAELRTELARAFTHTHS